LKVNLQFRYKVFKLVAAFEYIHLLLKYTIQLILIKNIMKPIIFFLGALSLLSSAKAQYSNYYLDIKQNINKKIDVDGQITVNQHISTIDYGQLAIANAQREKNRLESLKYANEQEKMISYEIATNPLKAYDYGYFTTLTVKGKDASSFGFKRFTINFTIPHSALFVQAGQGRYENISIDGVITELTINGPKYHKEHLGYDIEMAGKMEEVKEGAINEKMGLNGESIFIHKKDLKRAIVFGIQGYKSSLIWEDDYQYTITDNYVSLDTDEGYGVVYAVKVRTYGDKDEVTFEQLEGRRYYLKQLLEKVISTAFCNDMRY
jgi:hypothetical protein